MSDREAQGGATPQPEEWVPVLAAARRLRSRRELSVPAFEVLAALLLQFRNHKTGQCNPSVEQIVEATGYQRRAVYDAKAELVRVGLLCCESSPRETCRYTFAHPVRTGAPGAPVYTGAPTDTGCATARVQVHHGACSGAPRRTQTRSKNQIQEPDPVGESAHARGPLSPEPDAEPQTQGPEETPVGAIATPVPPTPAPAVRQEPTQASRPPAVQAASTSPQPATGVPLDGGRGGHSSTRRPQSVEERARDRLLEAADAAEIGTWVETWWLEWVRAGDVHAVVRLLIDASDAELCAISGHWRDGVERLKRRYVAGFALKDLRQVVNECRSMPARASPLDSRAAEDAKWAEVERLGWDYRGPGQ